MHSLVQYLKILSFAICLNCISKHSCTGLTVDNQLVSARSDCFERIALEAMMPFDKTFRTEDTNSLKMCKEKCIQAGEKCQTISFGVHRRGNGTCQLSTHKYSMSNGRPSGVIFDPDFDLYIRKTNCFDLSDNTIPTSDGTTLSTGGGGGGYGSSIGPTTPVHLPTRPIEGNTPILAVNPSPTTATTYNSRPPLPTGIYSTTLQHPLADPGTTLVPTTSDGDRLYFSHDVYPLYQYPTLYENNYPAPNEDIYIPGGYASNVPVVDEHYRPIYPLDDKNRPTAQPPPRPVFGLGYGTGYSYGQPELYSPTTSRPYDNSSPNDSPNYTTRPNRYPSRQPGPYPSTAPNDYPSSYRPYGSTDRPSRPATDHDYASTRPPYYPRPPDYDPNRYRPPNQRPGDFVDYTNRPDPPTNNNGNNPSQRPPVRDETPAGYGGGGGLSSTSSTRRPPIRDSTPAPSPGYGSNSPTRPPIRDPVYSYDSTSSTRPPIRDPSYGYGGAQSSRPPNRDPTYNYGNASPTRPPNRDPTYNYGNASPTRPPIRDPTYNYGNASPTRPPIREPAYGYSGSSSSTRPPLRNPTSGYDTNQYNGVRRNGSVAPPGGYNGDKSIATYFNPEDYLPGGNRRISTNRDRVPMDEMKGKQEQLWYGKVLWA